MRKFSDDDEGYARWLQEHPDGFVVNTYRRPSQNYLILHRAECPHISTRASESRRWTADYLKVCAANIEDLQTWARHDVAGTLTRCRTCAP
jgi:hypothetical protein